MSGWPSEHIPDDDQLYYRVAKASLKPNDQRIHPGVFRAHLDDRGMSTDWKKYATAAECRGRGVNPANNGVVRLAVGGVRACSALTVEHTPRPGHRSHTDVIGVPRESTVAQARIRLHLFNVTGPDGWSIRPEEPVEPFNVIVDE